jgi:hypothetical protein
VLHPRHKLSYFKTAGWEDEWIKTAEALVRDEFERSYMYIQDVEDTPAISMTANDSNTVRFLMLSILIQYNDCILEYVRQYSRTCPSQAH